MLFVLWFYALASMYTFLHVHLMYFSATFFNTTKPPAAKGLKYARTPISTSPFKVLIQGTVVVDAADLNCSIPALNSTCNMNTVGLML